MTDVTDPREWTMMMYISADDVLANFAVESLKELKRAASKSVTAVAQLDTSKQREVPRYSFNGEGKSDAGIESDKAGPPIPNPLDMANPQTLTDFIDWASSQYPAKHYCLILWGHGYELLLEGDPPANTNRSRRNYLTPADLRKALKSTKLATLQKKKLDIIGFDACSMSLVEVASEIQDDVDFMVASQEEVPDASFPYQQVLTRLEALNPNDVKTISAEIPILYKQAYESYIVAPGTGLSASVTLSSLRLEKIGEITSPLTRLAGALLSSISSPDLRQAVIDARKQARGFAGGLFVDLFDFCDKLSNKIVVSDKLRSACTDVCNAIDPSSPGKDPCVIKNETGVQERKLCHGLSIYFPYVTDGMDQQTPKPNIEKGGTNHPRKAAIGMIPALEEDFNRLDTFGKTDWNRFIANGWSYILAKEKPEELDVRYSSQQCFRNLIVSLLEEKSSVLEAKGPRAA